MSIHGKLDKKTITIIDSKEDILLDANDECRRGKTLLVKIVLGLFMA